MFLSALAHCQAWVRQAGTKMCYHHIFIANLLFRKSSAADSMTLPSSNLNRALCTFASITLKGDDDCSYVHSLSMLRIINEAANGTTKLCPVSSEVELNVSRSPIKEGQYI